MGYEEELEKEYEEQYEKRRIEQEEKRQKEQEENERRQMMDQSARRDLSGAGWALTVYVAAVVASEFFLDYLGVYRSENPVAVFLSMTVPVYIVGFPVFLFAFYMLVYKRKTTVITDDVLHGDKGQVPSITVFFMIFVASLGVLYFSNMIGTLFTLVLGAATGKPVINPVDFISNMNPVLVFVITVLMAPVFEELIFRKFLLSALIPYGDRRAVIYTALLFALLHGNFSQFFYAFPLGLMLGGVVCYSKKVRYSIGIHMMINLLGGTVAPFLVLYGTKSMQVIMGYFVIACVISAPFLLYQLRRYFIFSEKKPGYPLRYYYANPGILVYFAVCLIMFVMTVI